jgi:hypothetical protein
MRFFWIHRLESMFRRLLTPSGVLRPDKQERLHSEYQGLVNKLNNRDLNLGCEQRAHVSLPAWLTSERGVIPTASIYLMIVHMIYIRRLFNQIRREIRGSSPASKNSELFTHSDVVLSVSSFL